MKYPLLGPVTAIAAGILVYRFVPFTSVELLVPIAAFVMLAIFARLRGSRAL